MTIRDFIAIYSGKQQQWLKKGDTRTKEKLDMGGIIG